MENTLSSVGAVEKHSQNTEFCITGHHYRKGNNYCSSLGVMYLSDFNGVSVFYWFFCWVCSYFTQFMFSPWSWRPFPLALRPGTSCLQQRGLSGSPWHWCDPSLQPVKAYCQRTSSNQWQTGILLCWVLLSAAGSPDKLFRLLLLGSAGVNSCTRSCSSRAFIKRWCVLRGGSDKSRLQQTPKRFIHEPPANSTRLSSLANALTN